MTADLQKVRQMVEKDPRLAGFVVRRQEGELHLEKGGESFARLIPTGEKELWRIEIFRDTEEWEIVDFTGTIEECLRFLAEHPLYLFWER